MANAGLIVYAQDGSGAMQIDNTYRNYFLRTKVTLTLDQHLLFPSATSCGEKQFTVNCQVTPIIVVSGTNMVASDLLISPPAGGWNTPGDYVVTMVGPLNASIEVYVFDALKASDMSAVAVGLKVWGPSGEPIFNSAAKPLRVVAKLTAGGGTSPTGVAIPSGKKYGVLCNGGYFSQRTGSPVTWLYFGYGGAITSTGYATIGVFQTGSTTSGSDLTAEDVVAFVVDLTNYG